MFSGPRGRYIERAASGLLPVRQRGGMMYHVCMGIGGGAQASREKRRRRQASPYLVLGSRDGAAVPTCHTERSRGIPSGSAYLQPPTWARIRTDQPLSLIALVLRPSSFAMRLLLLLVGFVTVVPAAAQELSVTAVEPPNWWVGMVHDEVQLMLTGTGLHGLEASFPADGPRVAGVQTVANPNYAFIDVAIPADLPPGTYPLTIQAGDRTQTIDYPVLARAGAAGRYQGFGPGDAIYLIVPDRFANGDPSNDHVADVGLLDEYDPSDAGMRHGGDLQGVTDRLPYLADLGVTTLWLTPVLENSGRNSYHGYAATDLYRIDPRLGTNEDYRRFVAEAHRHGLKVVFDHVANHIGVRHPWVDDPPTPTWFNDPDNALPPSHFKLALADPYAAPDAAERLQAFWFVPSMPDLNQRDLLVATYLVQQMLWWTEFAGLDGIREDTYPYPDLDFMADWAAALRAEYPRLGLVGEIWEDQPGYLSLFQEGSPLPGAYETHLPSVMDFAIAEAFRAYLRGDGTLEGLYKVLSQDFLYADPMRLLTLFDNHDMARGLYLAESNTQRLQQALALLLTMRGIPQLLYGTELGMIGGASHVELRAPMPGGFPGDARDAFTEAGRTAAEHELFAFTQRLLHLRRQHPALTHGRTIHFAPPFLSAPPWRQDVYTYLRLHDEETILVVANGHDEAIDLDLARLAPWLPADGQAEDLLTGEAFRLDARGTLRLAPRAVRVVQLGGRE